MTMLDAAHAYADQGFHLIPVWRAVDGRCPCPRGADCVSPGKHPAIDSWQTACTTDYTTLRDWFATERHNLGVVCGPSGVCVVDVDTRNGGEATLAALVAELGPLPPTLTADSGGGGQHYVYRRPEGELVSKLGPGVDLLHDRRQFLVEPSTHVSGGAYRWRDPHAPIAELPLQWISRARPHRRLPAAAPAAGGDARVERARRYLAKIPGAVSGAGGHTQTFNAVAAVLVGFDLDVDTTYGLIASDYNQRCDPPWSEREIHHKIRSVAERCTRERGYLLTTRTAVTTASAAAPRPAPAPAGDWTAELLVKPSGVPKRAYHNVAVFVRSYPDYAGRWALDTMTDRPWFDGEPMPPGKVHEIRAHADQRLGFTPSPNDVEAAIVAAAAEREFHPIRAYLASIDWDGEPRLASVARDYLGTTEPLHGEMVRRWMIGAVARALRPGCKLDTALMLVGAQGIGKSTFFSTIGGAWHADSFIDITNKDSFVQIHSAWIYEFAELENVVTGARESRLKAWLTSTHDTFRAPYARTATSRPRSCVICGTTNRRQFLTDDTGSRRFWIVPVAGRIDRDLLASMRDQLWAEAVVAFESGETWWLDNTAAGGLELANEEFAEDRDAWADRIENWLVGRSRTTVGDVLSECLRIEIDRQDRAAQMRVARALRVIGWHRCRRGPTWGYERPTTTNRVHRTMDAESAST